jgi:hypothetical protein
MRIRGENLPLLPGVFERPLVDGGIDSPACQTLGFIARRTKSLKPARLNNSTGFRLMKRS